MSRNGGATYAAEEEEAEAFDVIAMLALVPELATWAMMLGGVGLPGLKRRLRRTSAT